VQFIAEKIALFSKKNAAIEFAFMKITRHQTDFFQDKEICYCYCSQQLLTV